ncbi:hypothetical protein TNCV_2981191 [Trichonephila clavipes]|nr:hypothetical protein TNCV_2981191 [Trichonephila clavipes]
MLPTSISENTGDGPTSISENTGNGPTSIRSELSDLSDDDNVANKTQESRVLEGESSSGECNEEKLGNI